jgi:hypothetical protein
MALVELERQRRAYAEVKKRLWGPTPVAVRPEPKPKPVILAKPKQRPAPTPPITDDEYVARMFLDAPRPPRPLSVREIQVAVCQRYGISRDDMLSKRADRKIAIPRHIAIYLARELTRFSLYQVGLFFRRHHTSALNSAQRAEEWIAKDPKVREIVDDLRERFCTPPIAELPRADTSDPPFLPPAE